MPDPDVDIELLPATLIRRLNQFAAARFMSAMAAAGHDLTPVQFSALSSLHTHPGVDQATLAGLIGYDRATLGKVVERLEAKALMKRNVCPNDRRARCLHLTESGAALIQAVRPKVAAIQPEILSGLSAAERNRLVRLLTKAVRSAEQSKHDAPPMVWPT